MPVYGPSASGSLIGTGRLSKLAIDVTAWPVGATKLVTVTGGLVRIESMSLKAPIAWTSAGAPTIDFSFTAFGTARIMSGLGLADFTTRSRYSTTTGSANVAGMVGASEAVLDPAGNALNWAGATQKSIGAILDSADHGIWVKLGVAVLTAGTLDILIIYTPLTPGATLT